jgi:hypothetical protein
VIPQLADGGGWRSTVVLTNTTAVTIDNIALTFYRDDAAIGPGFTQLWNLAFHEGSFSGSLPGGSSVFLHTLGTGPLSQGWAKLVSSAGVEAYVIYTYSSDGRDQDSTAPAVSSASRILVPFDNTKQGVGSLMTALAVVNPNNLPIAISANFKLAGPVGTIVQGTPLNLPSNGQMAFVLPTQFPGTAGQSGLAEFSTTSGSFSIIALRGNPTGGLTSLQVYYETGQPII